jgi:hypothetical protein
MSVGDDRWLQSRRAGIPGARSPRLFNFVRQRLTFMDPEYGT